MAQDRKLRVGLTYNLKRGELVYPADAEAEYDDEDTINAIRRALEDTGCAVELYEADGLLPLRLAQNKPDIVFNIAEGSQGRGREAQTPAILNYLHIPFTGSDEATMCVALDKALTKTVATAHNIRTPRFTLVDGGDDFSLPDLSYPLIVKPNTEGSGKGISDLSVVRSEQQLRRILRQNAEAYRQEMLVEEFIEGREFTVGILGNGDDMRIFPPMEIIFRHPAENIYSYAVKRDFKKYVSYACPADLEEQQTSEMRRAAGDIYRILRCRDCARIDFRLGERDAQPYFIEINPLPGLAPGYSDFPMIAEFCGLNYTQLVRGVLDGALARYGLTEYIDKGNGK